MLHRGAGCLGESSSLRRDRLCGSRMLQMQSPTISTEASGEGWGLLRGGDAPGEQVRSAVLLDGTGLQTKLVALG